ncbi:MAG: putative serine protease HhoB precursor [bacterium ADurb.Bin400]|nr:MAG: putative serine protease HhoB precursor [bacterium ADurb.Bin400]
MVDYDGSNSITGKKMNQAEKRRWIVLVVGAVVISLMLGAVGGVGGVLLFSANNGEIAEKFGLPNFGEIAIPTTKTEKLIIEESNAIIEASQKVAPAVVSIRQQKTVQDIFGQTFDAEGAGTGFIITSDGLILTNAHVVQDDKATYSVVMADGKDYEATVKSVDSYQDIAVLQIDARNLPVVELGDSDQLQVGQWVVAVGNALGKYQNSVTSGVVSGRNRKIQATDAASGSTETLDNLIQTDAAINPGNSGGPLVNLKGQVVGVNTAVATNAQGVGFAIPINEAKSAIESIKKTGRIVRPFIGVRYVQITSELAKDNDLPVDYGALIARGQRIGQVAVVPGSPADKAGLVENDIILEINGEKIDQNNSLIKILQQYQVGDNVELKILSKGSEKKVKVGLEERR